MKPNGGGAKLPGRLEKKITEDLGGLEKFKTDFAAAGVGQFGSGWAWLSVKNGKLEISKTPNGENPLVHGATPILGVERLGAFLLHRLSQSPPGLSEGVCRSSGELGIMSTSCSRRPDTGSVIPGWSEGPDRRCAIATSESRDSGFDASLSSGRALRGPVGIAPE